MAKFINIRDLSFIQTIAEEVVDYVVEQTVVLYKLSLDESRTNLYGESMNKIYHSPTTLMCIIDREPQNPIYEGMGLDVEQLVEFRFMRHRLRTIETPKVRNVDEILSEVGSIQTSMYGYPEAGDIIEFDNNFYEINHIRENKLVGGSPKIYDTLNKSFDDARMELIAPSLLVRNSQVQIKDRII